MDRSFPVIARTGVCGSVRGGGRNVIPTEASSERPLPVETEVVRAYVPLIDPQGLSDLKRKIHLAHEVVECQTGTDREMWRRRRTPIVEFSKMSTQNRFRKINMT